MNSVNLIGNLTSDPELRATTSGTPVGKMRIAINRRKKGGEDQGADYVDVTTFGKTAEICAEYLAKGRQVAVEGRLSFSQWETDDGEKRSRLEVIANQVDFIGSKPAAERQPAGVAAGGGEDDIAF